jgi:hypothetical protein
MKVFRKKLLIFLIVVIFALPFMFIYVFAEERFDFPNIVFLVDASGSMETSDPSSEGIRDCLEMTLGLLPKEAKIGLVTYSDQVNINSGLLDIDDERLAEHLQQITYSGNTNLASGLESAVNLLENKGANCKIILVSDGEPYLGRAASNEQIAEAEQLLDESLQRAINSQIKIDTYVISPHFDGDPEKIIRLSTESGGESKDIQQLTDLERAVESLCIPYYKTNFYIVTSLSTGSEYREVAIPIPTEYISKTKVFFSSETPVSDISFQSYQEEFNVVSGKLFNLLIIEKPKKENLIINFNSPTSESVKIYYIFSYSVHSEAKAMVSADANEKKQSAQIVADIIDDESGNSILKTGDFSRFEIVLEVKNNSSGEVAEINGTIMNGKIVADLPEGWLFTCTLSAKLESDGIIIESGQTKFTINSELTPLLEEQKRIRERRERVILVVSISLLILIIVIVVLLLSRRKPRKSETFHAEKEITVFPFAGKLDAYVTSLRDRNDAEIAPFSYYLASSKEKRISLQNILNACNIDYPFSGAAKLVFEPGPEKSLYVKNNGITTVLLRGAIMQRGKTFRLNFGERLYFTAEDGLSEIAVYYRNVKAKDVKSYRSENRITEI